MKKITSLLLAAALLTACSKHNDPEPAAPAPTTLRLERTLTFPLDNSQNSSLTYTQRSLDASLKLDGGALTLQLDASESVDLVGFTIPQASLAPNWLGTYAVRDRQNAAGKVVDARYRYTYSRTSNGFAYNQYPSGSSTAAGNVTITAYDSQRRVASGTFALTLDNVADPRSSSGLGTQRCNVQVAGSFDNLKVE